MLYNPARGLDGKAAFEANTTRLGLLRHTAQWARRNMPRRRPTAKRTL
jgi:hypothetical protein